MMNLFQYDSLQNKPCTSSADCFPTAGRFPRYVVLVLIRLVRPHFFYRWWENKLLPEIH